MEPGRYSVREYMHHWLVYDTERNDEEGNSVIVATCDRRLDAMMIKELLNKEHIDDQSKVTSTKQVIDELLLCNQQLHIAIDKKDKELEEHRKLWNKLLKVPGLLAMIQEKP